MKWLQPLRARFALARRFSGVFAGQRAALASIAALSLAVAALQVLTPWPIQRIVDGALTRDDAPFQTRWRVVLTSAAALLLLNVAQALIEYFAQTQIAKVGQRVARRLRLELFTHLTQLSPRFFAQHKTGDLLVRLVGDVSMARAALVDATLEIATRGVWVLGVLAVMVWLDWKLTAVLALSLPAIVLVSRSWTRRIENQARKQRRKEGALADFLEESLGAAELIQSLGAGPALSRRLARESRTAERAGQRSARLSAQLSGSVHALLGLGVALTLVAGSWRVLRGELSAGEMLVFVSYVRGLLKPVRSASRNSERIAKGVACARRIAEVLDEPALVRERPAATPAPTAPVELRFEGVRYSHDGVREALCGLDASFRRGELCGVFGASGAGKSTLAGLCVRLFDPSQGCVRIDGVDLRDFTLASLRERVGLCLQQPLLLGASVRENLCLGLDEVSDARLWQALESAGAATFVRVLSDGLESVLGASGVGLSGGQRRRLALARTLLRRAPILIVDEPFAGLDAAARSALLAHLVSVARESIVVVIAHERELLEHYDRVLWIEDGRAQDCGPHGELLERSARYGELARSGGTVSAS